MASLWGRRLAAGVSGRGRGSRALLRQARSAALVHDASYYAALQLDGPQAAVLAALVGVVAEPQTLAAAAAEAGGAFLRGARELPVMVSRRPAAEARRAVGDGGADTASRSSCADLAATSALLGSYTAGARRRAARSARQPWRGSHPPPRSQHLAPAAATEPSRQHGFGCTRRHMTTRWQPFGQPGGSAGGVECRSRARELLRLEVTGGGAEAALCRALCPAAAAASTEPDIWSAAASAPPGAMLGVEVDDPRDRTEARTLSQPAVGAVKSGGMRA
eukprot:SM002887S10739  [mRNA]  locus=s2887:120:1538:- [translate_table: standard]